MTARRYNLDGRYSLTQFPKELREAGFRFIQHRHNAELRGVGWEFTFEQWWKVWQDSGHWDQRGWGADRYCMCRFGDIGPYAASNVYIATNGENVRSFRNPAKTLPVGVRQQSGKFYATKKLNGVTRHLGTFTTPELARAAYENFTA